MTERTRVLIGYDASEHSAAAIADLARAGLPGDCEALVVTVGESVTIPAWASHRTVGRALPAERVRSIVDHADQHAAAALNQFHKLAQQGQRRLSRLMPGWKVRALAIGGDPATELVRYARSWSADLIVLGSRGHSAIGRFLLGSVSLGVANNAHCSVRIGRGAVVRASTNGVR